MRRNSALNEPTRSSGRDNASFPPFQASLRLLLPLFPCQFLYLPPTCLLNYLFSIPIPTHYTTARLHEYSDPTSHPSDKALGADMFSVFSVEDTRVALTGGMF